MTGNPEDLSSAREIALPEIWSFHNADRVLRWCHLAKAATVSNCTLRKAEPDCGKMPKWRVMLPDGEVLLVRKGHPPATNAAFANMLLARSVEMHGDRLVPDGKSTWLKHERL